MDMIWTTATNQAPEKNSILRKNGNSSLDKFFIRTLIRLGLHQIMLVILFFCLLFTVGKTSAATTSRHWYDEYRPTVIWQDLCGRYEYCPLVGAKDFVWPVAETGWKKDIKLPPGSPFIPLSPRASYNLFRRSFTLSPEIKKQLEAGDRIFLHLGGLAYRWQVRLNGQLLADSSDAFNSHNFDVTGLLRPNAANELVLGTSSRNSLAYEKATPAELAAVKPRNIMLAPVGWSAVLKADNPINGVWGEIELWARPPTEIKDVYIRSSVRNHELLIDTELVGKPRPAAINVRVLDSTGKEVLRFPRREVSVPAGGITVQLKNAWKNPILWDTENPYMYQAEVTLVDPANGKVLDRRTVPFGFREIWIKGGDLIMNGHRLFLARTSGVIYFESNAKDLFKRLMSRGANSARIHVSDFYRPGAIASLADRAGLLLIPEMPFSFADRYRLTDPRFWKNYHEMLTGKIRSGRNHPSIIMWSLANEILWALRYRPIPEAPKQLAEAAALVKRIDPSRPVQFDGDWDLFPLGSCEITNLHYPWEPSQHWYPTECWAFEKAPFKGVNGFDSVFRWPQGSKPIIIGEFSWCFPNYTEAPVPITMYAGDRAYDWNFWSNWKLWRQLIRWQCDAWRVARFAGINPWYHRDDNWKELMPLETVVLRQHALSFFSRENVVMDAYLLNDTSRKRSYQVRYSLIADKQAIFKNSLPVNNLDAGGMKALKMPLTLPTVTAPRNLNLTVSVIRDGKIVDTYSYPVRVRPAADLKVSAGTVLWDPVGKSTAAFKALGLRIPALGSLTRIPPSVRAVIVGRNALMNATSADKATLDSFVRGGGKVLCLPQKNAGSVGFALQTMDAGRAAFAWLRAPGHPALKNLTDEDLRLWRDGDWVADNGLEKPGEKQKSAWVTLIDAGSREGLNNALLLEVFAGKGRYLFCQLRLDKADHAPGARALLAGLLGDLSRPPAPRVTAGLIKADSDTVEKILNGLCIPTPLVKSPNTKFSVMIVDAEAAAAKPQQISQWVERGGRVLLYGLTPDNAVRWTGVVKGAFKLIPCDPPEGCLIKTADPLLWGISNEELFWAFGYWTERNNRTSGSKIKDHRNNGMVRTAKIASFAINPGSKDAIVPIDPAALVKVPQGHGFWLLSTLNLDDGAKAEPMKTIRLLEALATNLGLSPDANKIISYGSFQPISLAQVVNRGFQDDDPGNGKGGWSDQGESDLRFFPVNLSGVDLAGLPTPIPKEFPTRMILANAEFEILDPRQHHGKSCLMLTPNYGRLPKVIKGDYRDRVNGLKVGRRFDRLYSLHSSVWNQAAPGQPLWKYVLHYADGTSAQLPVRNKIEVGDWFKPRKLIKARVAWRGVAMKLSPVGLYIAGFDNPHPGKKVLTLDIISCKAKGIPGIIALSTAERQTAKKE